MFLITDPCSSSRNVNIVLNTYEICLRFKGVKVFLHESFDLNSHFCWGYRQQVLVKSIVKVKADRPRSSEPPSTLESTKLSTSSQESVPGTQSAAAPPAKAAAHQGGLLGLAYESEDDSDGEEPQEVPAAKRLKDETRDNNNK